MKEYTRIRRFYARVGFAVIWFLIIAIIAYLSMTIEFRPAKIEAAPLPPVQIAAVITAYSSSVDETDSTPNINAMGTRPHLGSVACPSQYKFGTEILIQGKTYQCDDRMAQKTREKPHFDIWMPSKQEALRFGNQLEIVTINL
jgi:3D (Asp-Asp-Asp) domain-containing protein